MTGGWRNLRNEKLHNVYSSPNIVRIISQPGNLQGGFYKRWEFLDKLSYY
jgi:hypothetical protein